MSKVVLFSNIKGGVGKTTLCAHFSEYLNEKGMSVSAADADIQASLTRHREREIEADPEHAVSWEIIKLNTLDAGKIHRDNTHHPLTTIRLAVWLQKVLNGRLEHPFSGYFPTANNASFERNRGK